MATRADGVQAALILVCGAVLLMAGHALGRRSELPSIEQVLAAGLSITGLMILGAWILVLLVAVVVEALCRRGSLRARMWARWLPAIMRRLAVALLGINVLAVPATAQAAPDHSGARSVAVLLPASGPTAGADGRSALPRAPGSGHPAPTVNGAPGTPGSPYWTPQEPPSAPEASTPAPPPASTSAAPAPPAPPPPPASTAPRPPALAPPAPAAPVTPPATTAESPAQGGGDGLPPGAGWEPAPVPIDGGPLIRSGIRPSIETHQIVVAPGDSLWSIVSGELGPLATDADVAATWPRWYEANRSVIGPDPGLVLPGQVLTEPG